MSHIPSTIVAMLLAAWFSTVSPAQQGAASSPSMNSSRVDRTRTAAIKIQGCVAGGKRYTFMQTGTEAMFTLIGKTERFATVRGKLIEIRGTNSPRSRNRTSCLGSASTTCVLLQTGARFSHVFLPGRRSRLQRIRRRQHLRTRPPTPTRGPQIRPHRMSIIRTFRATQALPVRAPEIHPVRRRSESGRPRNSCCFRGQLFEPCAKNLRTPPAMVLTAAETTQIDHYSDDQNYQIDTCDWHCIVHHPCIHQCGEWEEQESKERQKQPVIGSLQVIREEE